MILIAFTVNPRTPRSRRTEATTDEGLGGVPAALTDVLARAGASEAMIGVVRHGWLMFGQEAMRTRGVWIDVRPGTELTVTQLRG